MKIILFDIKQEMVEAWEPEFSQYKTHERFPVTVLQIGVDSLLRAHEIRGLVSPANSFGFMDGGIDGVYSSLIPGIQEKVQRSINTLYSGELPVGCATGVETEKENPFEVIAAPTMRVPLLLDNDLAMNCYLATRAVFMETVNFYSKDDILAIPGMGTGVGRLPVDFVAKSMRLAYEDILLDNFKFPTTLFEASEKHHTVMNWLQ